MKLRLFSTAALGVLASQGFAAPSATVDLSTYVRVGRYDLPEPTRTAAPAGNLLAQEASGVAYNWDTDTLFIACDGGRSITQVSKTGELIDTMTLAAGSSPQGTAFYDPEGITYLGDGRFVMTEERDRQLVLFTYAAGTALTRAETKTVKLGTFVDNTGTEGVSYDPQTGGFICLKEISPMGVFLTNVDFEAGTATNGSATTENSTNLFDPALTGFTDLADVFALSNLPYLNGQPQAGNLLLLSQENARIVNVDRLGNIASSLQIVSDAGNPLTAANQQHEGLTMDRDGVIYVVNENGGGDIDHPQLWVYAPSDAPNQAPTSISLSNAITTIAGNTTAGSPIKVADIVIGDDGLGANALSLTGPDAAIFEITGAALFIKAGTVFDFKIQSAYNVTVQVDDATLGSTPDASANFTITISDVVGETPTAPVLFITEVAPWGSGSSPYASDWFEVTNAGSSAVDLTGWRMDDSSNEFASGLSLNGVTSIAPGESVIFMETATAAELPAKAASFLSTWFGGSFPAGLQIGSYSGGGAGLSTGGDAVNLFDANGTRITGVSFGPAATGPFSSFENHELLGSDTLPLPVISALSAKGIHGASVAVNDSAEIGSPGTTGKLIISEVAPWSSGSSPVKADWFEVTNTGAFAMDLTGWKVDDSSESPAAAVALNGITSIAPGESVIFIETATPDTTVPLFISNWFGANPPAVLQIGSYTGSGIGLSTGGDAVNLYNSTGVRVSNVAFGASGSGATFRSFDNAAGLNVAMLSNLSIAGVRGAFFAANSAVEIGSPGVITGTAPLAGSFGAWLIGGGYNSAGFDGDIDSDGMKDGVEYFFNTDPNNSGSLDNLPRVTAGASGLQLGFSQLTNAVDAAGILETSSDLISWTPALLGIDYIVASSVVVGEVTDFTYALPGTGPSASSASTAYLRPNVSDPTGASLGGVRVVNEGLVGVGRMSGENTDMFGETQGASSGMTITDWAYADGRFSGIFNVLPDRGHGDGTSNYAARLHRVGFTFAPYYGTAPVAQEQVDAHYLDSTKFTYQDGGTTKFTSGLNPTGTATLFGQTVGTVTAANGAHGAQENLLSFDTEAVHLFADGSGFVSDEYGAYIARFNAAKQITSITPLPEAARPHRPAGVLNFDSVTAPVNGRRNNQGLEGMSVTPDGTRLFGLLQSATVQDTNGSQQQTRNHARLFVYDIVGANRENPVLVGEYVVCLPQIDLNSDGSGADGTAAQSEIVALGSSSFLMLPRDGNGLGKGTTVPILFKSVQLVDFASATNIIGQYDGEGQQISPGGVLREGINTAATAEVINMLQPDDLAKFGLNANSQPSNSNTLNEKIEAMALVPDLSTPQANDFFLFVGDDNDFESSDVKMLNAAGDVVSKGDGRLNAGITNDAMFYVWRLIIDADGKKFFRMNVMEK